MKLSRLKTLELILLMVLFMSKGFSQGNILDKKISITFNDILLKEALEKIEEKGGVSFAYSDLAELNQKVSADYIDQKLSDILSDLFKNTSLAYKIIGGKITIYKSQKNKSMNCLFGFIYFISQSGRFCSPY